MSNRKPEKQVELAAREKAKQTELDLDQVKHFEEHLKQVESISEELRAGKIGTKEAIQRLAEISERIGK
ncbi:hypothetical protein ACFLVM_01170 [Chloroflexota bacterium]